MNAPCPGCGHDMVPTTWEARYGRTVTIDECHACNGLWFDQGEAYQLAPSSLVRLFREVHGRQGTALAPQLPEHACPRCFATLLETHDRVFTTSFTYLACPARCGRFSTFVQFLREKQLARDATAKELDALKSRVQLIHCSSCGAPIDLLAATVCAFCGAPVTHLGTDSLTGTLAQLHVPDAASVQKTQAATADELARLLSKEPARSSDLVALGLEALFGVLR